MTKKQQLLIRSLLELLSSASLRDWSIALAEVDPAITGSKLAELKRNVKASLSKEKKRVLSISKPKKSRTDTSRMTSDLLDARSERNSLKQAKAFQDLSETVSRKPEQEFGRWLEIIGSTGKIRYRIVDPEPDSSLGPTKRTKKK